METVFSILVSLGDGVIMLLSRISMMGNKLVVTQFAKSKKHHGIDNVTELQLPDAVCSVLCDTGFI